MTEEAKVYFIGAGTGYPEDTPIVVIEKGNSSGICVFVLNLRIL